MKEEAYLSKLSSFKSVTNLLRKETRTHELVHKSPSFRWLIDEDEDAAVEVVAGANDPKRVESSDWVSSLGTSIPVTASTYISREACPKTQLSVFRWETDTYSKKERAEDHDSEYKSPYSLVRIGLLVRSGSLARLYLGTEIASFAPKESNPVRSRECMFYSETSKVARDRRVIKTNPYGSCLGTSQFSSVPSEFVGLDKRYSIIEVVILFLLSSDSKQPLWAEPSEMDFGMRKEASFFL